MEIKEFQEKKKKIEIEEKKKYNIIYQFLTSQAFYLVTPYSFL